jgi:hypothetical protein
VADMSWHVRREACARAVYRTAMTSRYVKHQVVCRYWVGNRCMSGSRCAFLHEYKLDKFPLCAYIETVCPDGEACMFRHTYLPGERRQLPRYDPSRRISNDGEKTSK